MVDVVENPKGPGISRRDLFKDLLPTILVVGAASAIAFGTRDNKTDRPVNRVSLTIGIFPYNESDQSVPLRLLYPSSPNANSVRNADYFELGINQQTTDRLGAMVLLQGNPDDAKNKEFYLALKIPKNVAENIMAMKLKLRAMALQYEDGKIRIEVSIEEIGDASRFPIATAHLTFANA